MAQQLSNDLEPRGHGFHSLLSGLNPSGGVQEAAQLINEVSLSWKFLSIPLHSPQKKKHTKNKKNTHKNTQLLYQHGDHKIQRINHNSQGQNSEINRNQGK